MFTITDEVTPSGFRVISLDEGRFSGVKYAYTKVNLPEGDPPVLRFDYNVLDGGYVIGSDDDDFKNTIGDILVALMEKSCESGNLVFFGGR